MLRKVMLGSGLVALVPTVRAATPIEEKPSGSAKAAPVRPSDLPLYEPPLDDYGQKSDKKSDEQKSVIFTTLQEPVKTVRQQAQSVWEQTESAKNAVKENYNHYADKTDWIVKYLREEENKEARYGAVAIGGLTGYIFGLRGGIIRRLLYATVGTTIMGSVCFPEETKDIYNNNGKYVKQYLNIAYNFLYGVKPGDPQLELNFPELSFPKDFSEFVDLTASVANSVKQAVMPPQSKEEKPAKKE